MRLLLSCRLVLTDPAWPTAAQAVARVLPLGASQYGS
jgi:hypothetical protein